jgi:NAD(P)-dependent dehydrogenase (short-subunit alcohol dehydrogenase family)
MAQQTIYITGAGSGIGQELAKRHIRNGASVALFDLRFSDEAKTQLEKEKQSRKQVIAYLEADVTELGALEEVINNAEIQVGLPDLAIHCAGIQDARPFEEMNQQDFERVIAINLYGSRNFAQACLPLLEKNKKESQLVFIASMAGIVGNYGYSAYCSSKFAVVGLAQVLRLEYAPKGIRVQVICPPEVDTPMVHEEHKYIHPVTLKLKMTAGSLSLDYAVNEIMRGLSSKRFYIIPGKLAKFTYWLTRYVPVNLSNFIVDKIVKKELNRVTT